MHAKNFGLGTRLMLTILKLFLHNYHKPNPYCAMLIVFLSLLCNIASATPTFLPEETKLQLALAAVIAAVTCMHVSSYMQSSMVKATSMCMRPLQSTLRYQHVSAFDSSLLLKP